jgi:hypothetical protein
MPTNNYQITWDPTNKKWTCIEDGAAPYDLVENSTVELEDFEMRDVTAAPHPTATQTKLGHHTDNWFYLRQAAGDYDLLQPLTAKGHIHAKAAGYRSGLAVGADGTILTADSTQTFGIKWGAKFSSPLTTKGDIYCYAAADTRLPIAGDYRYLVADSSQTCGMQWLLPPYCEVYRSGAITMVNRTAYNITWNGETSDAWNMAAGTIYITAPMEGVYLLMCSYDINGLTGSNPDASVRIRPVPSAGNQAICEMGWRWSGANYPQAMFHVRLPNAGTFYIQIHQDSNISVTGMSSTTWSRLFVQWIGPYN